MKRMGVGILIFNNKNEILIVKSKYKNHWSLPGGVVDKDESPREGGLREMKEEIGIILENIKFLCIDYISAKGEKNENLQFIFTAGILNSNQIKAIKIKQDEISEYKFLKVDDALPFLSEEQARRLLKCFEAIKSDAIIYLENGNHI